MAGLRRPLGMLGLGLGLGLFLLVALMGLRTAQMTSVQVAPAPTDLELDPARMASLVGEAVRFRTVSNADPALVDTAEFDALQGWMQERFPLVAARTARTRVAGQSLLMALPGTQSDLTPVVLMAHQDVVPVETGTESDWTHPPFSGVRAPCGDEPGDCVWGRGTIDMKPVLVALLEATEQRLAAGWAPRRTILFAFGHDEEVGGSGAQAMAAGLEAQGTRAHWVLDEGLLITDGIVPGLEVPAALIGISEKGFMSVSLTAESTGGHSSMPPDQTAVGVVAAAVARLEANPFPAALDGAAAASFARLAPELPLGTRLAMANLWLLEPVVVGQLTAKTSTNALLRTTQAATMFEGSAQDNVLPQRARAVVNLRVHPRDTLDGALERMRRVIADERVVVAAVAEGSLLSPPSPVSPVDHEGYRAIEGALRGAYPSVVVAPGLFIAASDARHFTGVSDAVYRFHPNWLKPSDQGRIHATNERVRVDNLAGYLRFYGRILALAGA